MIFNCQNLELYKKHKINYIKYEPVLISEKQNICKPSFGFGGENFKGFKRVAKKFL